MRAFEIHTEETVRAVYVCRAESEEQARQMFHAGMTTKPAVYEAVDVEIKQIKEV